MLRRLARFALYLAVFLVGGAILNTGLWYFGLKSDWAMVYGFVLIFAGMASVVLGFRIVHRVIPLLILAWLAVGCTRVEPGKVGIQANQWGADKGVSSFPRVSGAVTYNPITTDILEYPTFVQTAKWERTQERNEEISFNSKEGLIITGDISLSYYLTPDKIPQFYVKFRSDDLETFTHGFLRNVARDAFNEEAPHYAVDELYGPKKEQFLANVMGRVNKKVAPYGVILEQFGFIGAPRLPKNVVDALNATIKATQDAIRVENELRSATAEAQKRIAAAEGEAKSNAILTSSLNPTLLEWRRLEIMNHQINKWNGVLPQVSGGVTPFIAITPNK